MAPHSSTLAWKMPWREKPGRLQSMGSLKVRHDWATSLSLFTFILEKEMETHSSVLVWRISGTAEPGGLPSMGSHRVGHEWSDLAAAAAECWRSLLPTPVWPLPICLDSWTWHSRFLCSIALYSIRSCFYHQSYPQLGIVFALAPSLHSFWSYFSTDLQ